MIPKLCVISAAVIFGSFVAQATPTISSKTTITNTTDSQAFVDTDDKTRIWVLPPTTGRADSPTFSMETPASECETMGNIITSARLYSHQILILATQRDNLLTKLGDLTDKTTPEAVQIYTQSEAINTLIMAAYNSMNSLVSTSARNHGGTLLVPYLHRQAENIETIRNENPAYTNVGAVQTYHGRLYFSAPGSIQDGLDISLLPIIDTYSVSGVTANKLAHSTAEIAPRLDVTVSLTRMGACLIQFPEKFGSKTAPKFGLTAIYDYPFAFTTSVHASYNLKNIYRFLKESGSSGGLFSSKSWSRTLELNWGESALKFSWRETDPELKVTPADRLEIEKSVKADLLASIDRLVMERAGLPPAQAANPGPHGATVLANSLDKTCSVNAYCAAASIALRTLDAVFGSSSTSTQIEKSLDVTATYEFDSSIPKYVSQGISYSGN